jgi:hypothetical protein
MSIVPLPIQKKNTYLIDFLSGGIAGIISKTVVAPV